MTILEYNALINLMKNTNANIWMLGIVIILIAIFSVAMVFLKGYVAKKSELQAITDNFEILKQQLIENTKITKTIESSIGETQWINQQIWIKKQSCYEDIFKLLLNIKNHIDHICSGYNESQFYDDALDTYGYQFSSPEEEDRYHKEIEQQKRDFMERTNSPEEKEKEATLKKRHLESMNKITDLLFIYAIFLDSRVGEEFKKMLESVNKTFDYESWDEHFHRLENDVNTATTNIQNICRDELKILG
ncbi:hypothetical protein ABEH48_000197 [Yersinia enterocolitica]|uniref:hypothetical protein n=1 Tax=Yersinia enterocolitica TaxID=630 RepID=UPI0029B3AE70|nr:hypothetical protein [Yersinia enterocolitica]ELW8237449.1 hypothetical protein [Yersinia enterocolitica]